MRGLGRGVSTGALIIGVESPDLFLLRVIGPTSIVTSCPLSVADDIVGVRAPVAGKLSSETVIKPLTLSTVVSGGELELVKNGTSSASSAAVTVCSGSCGGSDIGWASRQ